MTADPYAVLGVSQDATPAEINAAYRSAVRACHPDTARPDRERLAAVIAAYRQLRRQRARATGQGENIPVRVHKPREPGPDLRAGPVRRHPTE
jgi:curved DNA-binding protein CbpA